MHSHPRTRAPVMVRAHASSLGSGAKGTCKNAQYLMPLCRNKNINLEHDYTAVSCGGDWLGQKGDVHTLQVWGRPVNLSALLGPIPGPGQTAKGCESKGTRHGVMDTRWLRRDRSRRRRRRVLARTKYRHEQTSSTIAERTRKARS